MYLLLVLQKFIQYFPVSLDRSTMSATGYRLASCTQDIVTELCIQDTVTQLCTQDIVTELCIDSSVLMIFILNMASIF